MRNKTYTFLIEGNRVEVTKKHRTKTQYEYFLKIFMGDSDYESILNYTDMWLTKRAAISHASEVISNPPKAKILKAVYY